MGHSKGLIYIPSLQVNCAATTNPPPASGDTNNGCLRKENIQQQRGNSAFAVWKLMPWADRDWHLSFQWFNRDFVGGRNEDFGLWLFSERDSSLDQIQKGNHDLFISGAESFSFKNIFASGLRVFGKFLKAPKYSRGVATPCCMMKLRCCSRAGRWYIRNDSQRSKTINSILTHSIHVTMVYLPTFTIKSTKCRTN